MESETQAEVKIQFQRFTLGNLDAPAEGIDVPLLRQTDDDRLWSRFGGVLMLHHTARDLLKDRVILGRIARSNWLSCWGRKFS